MLDKIDGLAGTTPWILKDFRSPRRVLPGIQDFYNMKGVMSDKGEKKKILLCPQAVVRGEVASGTLQLQQVLGTTFKFRFITVLI